MLLGQLSPKSSTADFVKVQRLQNRMMADFFEYTETHDYGTQGHERLRERTHVTFRIIDGTGGWHNFKVSWGAQKDPMTGQPQHVNPAYHVAMSNLWVAARKDCDFKTRIEFLAAAMDQFKKASKFFAVDATEPDITKFLPQILGEKEQADSEKKKMKKSRVLNIQKEGN